MKNLIYVLLASLVVFTWSCNNPETENNIDDKELEVKEEKMEEKFDGHPHEMGELTLNHGERWEANEATTTAIANMLEHVNVYQATEGDDKNVEELQSVLNKEFKLLVERCTMKGEAHEQLHHYILPLKTFIDELNEGNHDKNVQVLKSYLLKYEEYFV